VSKENCSRCLSIFRVDSNNACQSMSDSGGIELGSTGGELLNISLSLCKEVECT